MKSLIVYPKGGLANRLRALASAQILAEYTGRKLFVNWVPAHKCNVEWEELFVNRLEHSPFPLSSFQAGVNLYDDGDYTAGFYWDMPRLLISNNSDVVAVHTCRNFQSMKMTQEEYKNAKSFFYKSLQPVSVIQKIVSDMRKEYFEKHDVVGIHIRRTDHLFFINKDPRLVCPIDQFIETMTGILKNNPRTKFFLATDDKNEETRIREIFKDAVIVYEKENVCRNTRRGMQDALIDWLLLSSTSKIIGSYMSSFTEEAGSVNRIRTETIPKKEKSLALKRHFSQFKSKGLHNYFLYSYYYRKGQVIDWIVRNLRFK